MNSFESTEQEVPARAGRAEYVVLAVALLLRIAWPFGSSPTHVDEGGWPLSVRQWVTEGLYTFDFPTAPLFHVVLGFVYTVAPPTMLTARVFAVVLGLLSVWLLWWSARRILEDERAAVWSALLWAACFPASELAGRALIEPQQLVWLFGVLAVLCMRSRAAGPLVALTTAGVLLTKANAVVVLPAFGVALFWDRSAAFGTRRWQKLAGLAAGLMIALSVYAGLYLYDPESFRLGWSATMRRDEVETAAGAIRLGRFALDPRAIEHGIEFLSSQSPFLFAFGIAGAVRSVIAKQGAAAGLWIALLLPFLLIQAAQPPHYFAVLYPALAFASAAVLADAMRQTTGRLRWPAIVVLVIAAEGLGRTVVAQLLLTPPERPAVAWLRAHVSAPERVVAAPYILMQLRTPGVSIFTLATPGFAPDSDAIQRVQPTWFVYDTTEWEHYLRLAGHDSTAVEALFSSCCERSFSDDAIRVYRLRPAVTPTGAR